MCSSTSREDVFGTNTSRAVKSTVNLAFMAPENSTSAKRSRASDNALSSASLPETPGVNAFRNERHNMKTHDYRFHATMHVRSCNCARTPAPHSPGVTSALPVALSTVTIKCPPGGGGDLSLPSKIMKYQWVTECFIGDIQYSFTAC